MASFMPQIQDDFSRQMFMALSGLGGDIGGAIQGRRQTQDFLNLAQFLQDPGRMAPGQIGPQLPPPGLQTPQGAQMLAQMMSQQQPQGDPFTLSPGQQRFSPTGQPIASLPGSQSQQFSDPFPISGGGLAQRDPSGKIVPITGTAPKTTDNVFQQVQDPQTGEQINALVNKQTGNIVKKFGSASEGLTPKDKATVAISQAKEFRTSKSVESHRIIEKGFKNVKAAAGRAIKSKIKGPADILLAKAFQKMTDEMSSVREGEFFTTFQGLDLWSKVKGTAEKVIAGGLGLTEESRQEFVDVAQLMLDHAENRFDQTYSDFSSRADELGLNKKVIFGNRQPFGSVDISNQLSPLSTAEEARRQELMRKQGL